MTEQIKKEILSIHPNFNKEELDNGLSYFEEKFYKAKDIISEKGKITEYLYFANSSVIRCYYNDKNGDEQTLWMKPEKTFSTEYKSFTSNKKINV